MTQKEREVFDSERVTCYVDDKKVDCETWGDPVAKAEADIAVGMTQDLN